MKVYVGIDGGGTKTRAIAVTSTGKILADLLTEGSNLNHWGWERFQEILLDLFAKLRSSLPDDGELRGIYLGLAGVGRHGEWKRVFELVRSRWPGVPTDLAHDAMPALVSGCGKKEGLILIGGTGAFAFGINGEGTQCQVGGWGYLLGDEGSGYDIGRRALQAVMQCYDGRGQHTLLAQKVLAHYDIGELSDLIPIVYSQHFSRNQIAAMARLVFEAAKEGDEIAWRLLSQAADELCELVNVVLKRLFFADRKVTVVLTGGLFHEGSPLVGMLERRLQGWACVVRNERPPAVGAVKLAVQLARDRETPALKKALGGIV